MPKTMYLMKADDNMDMAVHPPGEHTGLIVVNRHFDGGKLSLVLTRDQSLWLASALAEATSEQPTVTVTEVTP